MFKNEKWCVFSQNKIAHPISLTFLGHVAMLSIQLWFYKVKQLNITKYFKPISFSCCRITITYFAISGLDVLNALDTIPEEKKQNIIEWIYSLQITDSKGKYVYVC